MKIITSRQQIPFIGLLLLTLTGCSTYQESFDCPVGEGVRCASLSTINTKMNKGQIDTNEPVADQSTEPASTVYLSPQFRAQLQTP